MTKALEEFGIEQVFSNTYAFDISADLLDSTRVCVGYSGDSGGTVQIGEISGNTVTWGSEQVFKSGSGISATSVATLDSTHICVAYEYQNTGRSRIGTISGNTITWGPEQTFNAVDTNYVSVVALDSTHVYLSYNDAGSDMFGIGRIGTISGNTITWGSESLFRQFADNIVVVALDSTHVCVTYLYNVTQPQQGTYQVGRIGTISGNTITWGSEQVLYFGTSVGSIHTLVALDSTHIWMGRADATSVGVGVIGTVSGDTITLGSSQTFNSGTTAHIAAIALDSTHICVSYQDGGNSNRGTSRTGTISGDTITWDSEQVFNSATTDHIATASLNSDHIGVFYRDAGNSNKGTSIVGRLTDVIDPEVTITVPTGLTTYLTNTSTLSMAGTASDNVELDSITWSNSAGGTGSASGLTNWTISNIPLAAGENIITITATDTTSNTSTDVITVTRDVSDPVVTISTPRDNYYTAYSSIDVSGDITDDSAIDSVDWVCSEGSSDSVAGSNSFSFSSIPLVVGTNVIQISATDASGNTGFSTISVDNIPDRNKIKTIYNIFNTKGNLRGKAKEGFVRPTLKQFFMSVPDFVEVESYTPPSSYTSDLAVNPVLNTNVFSGPGVYLDDYTTFGPQQAFNDLWTDGKMWHTGGKGFPSWIAYKFTETKQIEKYTIRAYGSVGNANVAPMDWTLQGSNNSTNGFDGDWTTLDTITGETSWGSGEYRSFTFINSNSFTFYKLVITASNSSYNGTVVGEIEFMEGIYE